MDDARSGRSGMLSEAARALGNAWDRLNGEDLAERWSRLANTRNLNEFGYDSFGFSPDYIRRVLPVVRFFYRVWFRVETFGIRNVPAGRVLIIANHSGQLPFDAMALAGSQIFDADPPRIVRAMIEKWVPTLPFVSEFMARCGQIVGIPDNCRHLLENEEAILVFPEGSKGISKTWDKRYQLQKFGYGFMRLALQTNTPIVPAAVIGAEEQAPALWNAESIARLIAAPAFPITPTFPWLLPIGALPYPTRYRLIFGEPMHFEGDPQDDDAVIGRKVKRVKTRLQAMINEGLRSRPHIFW